MTEEVGRCFRVTMYKAVRRETRETRRFAAGAGCAVEMERKWRMARLLALRKWRMALAGALGMALKPCVAERCSA